jgi:hypothetical protein
MRDGSISIRPGGSATDGAAIPQGRSSHRIRRREEREAEKRRKPSSDGRTRRRWPSIGMQRPAEAATRAALQTGPRSPARSQRRLSSNRPAAGRNRGWRQAAAERLRRLREGRWRKKRRSVPGRMEPLTPPARHPRGNARTKAQTESPARKALFASHVGCSIGTTSCRYAPCIVTARASRPPSRLQYNIAGLMQVNTYCRFVHPGTQALNWNFEACAANSAATSAGH